jgi:hypothetical protein
MWLRGSPMSQLWLYLCKLSFFFLITCLSRATTRPSCLDISGHECWRIRKCTSSSKFQYHTIEIYPQITIMKLQICQFKKLESKESWMESTKLKPKHEENGEGENFPRGKKERRQMWKVWVINKEASALREDDRRRWVEKMHVVKTIVNRFSLTIKLAVLPYAFKSEKNIPLIGETSVSNKY